MPFFLRLWKQLRTQTPPICSLRDWALTSWSPWIDCAFSCGKMARYKWRKHQAFKLNNGFGFSPYLYRNLDVLVQKRSCNQRCYYSGTLKDIWCSCKQGYSGFFCEKGEQYREYFMESAGVRYLHMSCFCTRNPGNRN